MLNFDTSQYPDVDFMRVSTTCLVLALALMLLGSQAMAQAIDLTPSFRMMDSDAYVRLHYENDFFSATDYYYSQGINLEIVHPVFQKFFMNRMLVSARDNRQSGVAFEHNGYTPTRTDSEAILYGDRPYAATLTARLFSSSSNSLHKRITSSLTLGVIGPAAGGKAMQSTIHQLINDAQPLGWQNQIQNDVVVNYEVGLERSLVSSAGMFVVNASGKIRVGTLNTKASVGAVILLGRLNGRISALFAKVPSSSLRKLAFHLYWQPMVNLVGYDATLQGGLFNKNSPYTISAEDVTRLTFQSNAGIVMNVGWLNLEYFQTFLTKEFATGMSHQWGGVRVGVKL